MGSLEVAGPFRTRECYDLESREEISIIGAFTYVACRAMENFGDLSTNVPRPVASTVCQGFEKSYDFMPCSVMDERICFIQPLDLRLDACYVKGTLKFGEVNLPVVFKVWDCDHCEIRKLYENSLEREVSMYKVLEDLQGTVIPEFYAYLGLGPAMQVIAIEDCGQPGDGMTTMDDVMKIKSLLGELHKRKVSHGDIAPHNFVKQNGAWRVVDLMAAQLEGDSNDMAEDLRSVQYMFDEL